MALILAATMVLLMVGQVTAVHSTDRTCSDQRLSIAQGVGSRSADNRIPLAMAGTGLLVASAEQATTPSELESKELRPPEWAKGPMLQSSTEFGKTSYRVGLFWEKIDGAVAYKAYRSTTADSEYASLATVNENAFLDNTVALGLTYYYVVTALDGFSRETGYTQKQSISITEAKAPERKKRLQIIPRPTTRLWQVFDKRHDADAGGQDTLLGDAFDLAYDRQADLLYLSSTYNRRIVVLRGSDGSVLRQFGPRLGDYEIGVPLGLSLDRAGNLYIVDGKKNTIAVLTREGGLIRVITVARQAGEKEQRLIDVAVGPDGMAFVTDNANGKVVAVDDSGREIRRWGESVGKEGRLAGFTKIAVTAEGDLVVIDGISQKIQFMSPLGNLISSFGERKISVDGFLFLSDVALHNNGQMLVVDAPLPMVREFRLRKDPGMYVANLANSRGDGSISVANPLAITGDGEDLFFVIDGWGGRVSAFRLGEIRGSR